MSLQLILGGSGSGKTHHLYNGLIESSMRSQEKNHFAIVPEQFTMETQKEIVSMHPKHGVMNVDIVSFARLAFRIFEELALEHFVVLDDLGKSMILRKVAADKKKELGFFANHLHKAGFIDQLKSMLSEFYQYGVTLEQLNDLAANMENQGLLKEKLKDLSVIYEGFREYLKESQITTEEILDVLCRVLPDSSLIKNSVITLDGYTGFTPVQYRLIGLLMVYAKKVTVTVTIDDSEVDNPKAEVQDLFYLSKQTLRKLTDLAATHKVPMEEPVILGKKGFPRFRNKESPPHLRSAESNEPLVYLEKHFMRFGNSTFSKEQTSVSLHCAKNPGQEAEFVAGKISYLVRECNYRYQDIAVITGDVEGYRNSIVEKFETGNIPYFLDDKRTIMGNPLVAVIRSALLVVEENFSYESVFRYLKTGMTDMDKESPPHLRSAESFEDLDTLENYVIALGIRGNKRWQEPWERVYRTGEHINLDKINALRVQATEPLLKLYSACKAKGATVRDYAEAVFHVISGLSLEDKLKKYEQEFEALGEFSLAKEYSQAYGLVLGLLDQVVELMGDEVISIREFNDILDSGFEEIKVGIIPSCIDQVVVGDIERTRLQKIKVLFFIGVNDGIVPMSEDKGGILSEAERDFLERSEVELAPTAKKNTFIQRFYLYLLVTKPSERLYISYAKMGSDGASKRPSYLIGHIGKLFPALSVEDEEVNNRGIGKVITEKTAFHQLIEELREHKGNQEDTRWKEVYRWFANKPEYSKRLGDMLQAVFYHYEEKGMSGAVARALYGTAFSGSVTRLEQYAACSYAHFLSYGLELVKRQEYELASMDMGNIFHRSIDLFFKEFHNRNYDWHTISVDERKALVSECVEKVAEEYENTILKSSARNLYLTGRLLRITDRTVWALGEQIKQGDFKQAAFEVGFSSIDSLEASCIMLSDDEVMQLKGRIDRLDICEDEDKVYVKIIDYKSGGTSFDLASLYYGLQMQLVVYMDAALEIEQKMYPDKEVIPAGIFYYNIQDPIVEREGNMEEEDINRKILKELRMNGLVNRDEEVLRHLDRNLETDSKVIPVAKSAKTGDILEYRSSVASEKQFEQLRFYVRGKLKDMGQDILIGNTQVNPYKKRNKTACDYCEYKAVCGFDVKVDGYGYRRLKDIKPEEIWEKIGEAPSGDA